MEYVAFMPFLIPIVAILAGTYYNIAKMKTETARELGKATDHLEDELAEAKAERDRLRQRLEAVEAIVTSEGFDLEREARRAGITGAAGRIDQALLDLPEPDDVGSGAERRRVR
jgi:hypothetical protein